MLNKGSYAQPLPVGGGLDVTAEAVFLSGLLLASLWDRRSGTRGLDGLGGLRSPGSLQNTSSINIFASKYHCIYFKTNMSFISVKHIKNKQRI